MKKILSALFLLLSLSAFSQVDNKKIIQVSGFILGDSGKRAAFVNIINPKLKTNWTYTDLKGYFSFATYEGDTLEVTSVGYKKVYIIVPKNIENGIYTVVKQLSLNAIPLAEVNVFAITPEEFKKLFVSIKIPDDDLARAKKNLEKQVLAAISASLPRDGQETSREYMNNYSRTNLMRQSGMAQTLPFLDPYSIYQFIQLWRDGKISFKNVD